MATAGTVPNRRGTSRYAVTGLVGGALSGLLGIGGGTVMVPLLVLWAGRGQREAHAMSLAAIVPISLAAVVVYGGAGEVDVPAAAALTLGSVAGSRVGAGILARAPDVALKAAFGCFMIIAACSTALKS
jgi:uncharacterized membrane protein YfcA